MPKFDRVLIASDLDGTLLDTAKNVPPRSYEAIEYFCANGGRFTVCTGRLYQSFAILRDKIPFNAPVVFANGSMLYDYIADKIVWQCGLTADAADVVRDILSQFDYAGAEIYRFGESYFLQMNDVSREHIASTGMSYIQAADPGEVPFPWTKVIFTADPDRLPEIEKYITARDYPAYKFIYSTGFFYEMISAETDKGRGVLRLAGLLDIKPNDIYTCGDHINDLDMLGIGRLSFAPSGSHERVLAAADVVLGSCDEAFIAQVIEYLDKIY